MTRSALRLALADGTLLNLVNQAGLWLHGDSLHLGRLVLNYLVPYCVAQLQCSSYPLAGYASRGGQGRAVQTGRDYSRLPARVGSLSCLLYTSDAADEVVPV